MTTKARPEVIGDGKLRLGGRLPWRRHVRNTGRLIAWKCGRRRRWKVVTNCQWKQEWRILTRGARGRLAIGRRMPSCPTFHGGN
jgi:hypothetical protein